MDNPKIGDLVFISTNDLNQTFVIYNIESEKNLIWIQHVDDPSYKLTITKKDDVWKIVGYYVPHVVNFLIKILEKKEEPNQIGIKSSDHLSFLLANDEISILEIDDTLQYLAHKDYNIITYIDKNKNKYYTEGIYDSTTNKLIEPKLQIYEKSFKYPNLELTYYGKISQEIGKGTYGSIYKIGEKYAYKKMNLIYDEEIDQIALREIVIILRLNHPNIINIIDINIDNNKVYMLMPLAFNDLNNFKDFIKINEIDKKFIIYQMIQAVAYCSSRDILHGDIKPSNFLIYKNNIIKLIDFGFANGFACSSKYGLKKKPMFTSTMFTSPEENQIFTLLFRPPEILLSGEYNLNADIWALGISIYTIYTQNFSLLYHENFETIKDTAVDRNLILKNIFLLLGNPIIDWPDIVSYPKWEKFVDIISKDKKTKYLPFPIIKDNDSISWPKPIPDQLNSIIRKMIKLNPSNRENLINILNLEYFDDVKNNSDLNIFINYEPKLISCEDKLIMRSKISNPLNLDSSISKKHIDMVFFWLYEVLRKRKSTRREIFSFIEIFDICFNDIEIKFDSFDKLKLYMGSCLYLSSILNNNIEDALSLSDIHLSQKIDIKDLLDICKKIIEKSKFDLYFSTSYDFIEIYKKFYSDDIINLTIAILYITIFTDLRFKYSKKNIVLICIFMACCYYNKPFKHKEPDFSLKQGYMEIIENLQINDSMKEIFNKESIDIDFLKFIKDITNNNYCN